MSTSNPSISPRDLNPLILQRRMKSLPIGRGEGNPQAQGPLAPEPFFLQAMGQERKRAERSGKHFLLMLLKGESVSNWDEKAIGPMVVTLGEVIRDTDQSGWYRQGKVVGIIFTEVDAARTNAIQEVLKARVIGVLRSGPKREDLEKVQVSIHVFPEPAAGDGWHSSQHSAIHRETREQNARRRVALLVKRLVDIAGSAAALIALSPIFAVIAAAIKLTSKGPVLYRQVRIGHYGRGFTFLKFRSMYLNSSPAIHQEFVKGLIRGNGNSSQGNGAPHPGNGVSLKSQDVPGKANKMTRDPRVTPFGRFLRKTSLDELPQFLNVLKGEMSLVGPRPPVLYELEEYDAWHRRRLLEAKPGVTGLWQVSGRSMTTFDEMVRLDLRYAKSWSLWLDFCILARTPWAVFSGEGAY